MNSFDLRSPTPSRRGMKASTRMSMIAGVVVFLTLISGVSFAAWTATSTRSATATTGAVSIMTGATTASTTSTIAALGPAVYKTGLLTATKPITVRNTGTVAAALTSVAIARPIGTTNTLPGTTVDLKFWAGASNGTCSIPNTGTAVVSATLASTTAALSTLGLSVPAGGAATVCASTTFNSSLSTHAGKTISTELLVSASAGANWSASDTIPAAGRNFTQSVSALDAPTNMQCSTQSIFFGATYEADISWTAPATTAGTTLTYQVYIDYGAGPVLIDTVSTTTYTVVRSKITGNGSVTVRTLANGVTQSAHSDPVPVKLQSGWYTTGVACGS